MKINFKIKECEGFDLPFLYITQVRVIKSAITRPCGWYSYGNPNFNLFEASDGKWCEQHRITIISNDTIKVERIPDLHIWEGKLNPKYHKDVL